MFIYPYKEGSNSAKALAVALGAKMIRLENSKFRGSPDKVVINWGNSMTNEEIEKAVVLNKPEAIQLASDKLVFFETVNGKIPIPEWTLKKDVVFNWLESSSAVVREVLNGHSGKGIVVVESAKEFETYLQERDKGKLYTRYIPKKDEFRIHVVGDQVVDIQQKRRDREHPTPNWNVRNRANGFIYARENVELPDKAMEQYAIDAVKLCGLHFGAVDLVWNAYRKQGYVLEVNTAPGLEGQTVVNYGDALHTFVAQLATAVNTTRPTRNQRGLTPAFTRVTDEVLDAAFPRVFDGEPGALVEEGLNEPIRTFRINRPLIGPTPWDIPNVEEQPEI